MKRAIGVTVILVALGLTAYLFVGKQFLQKQGTRQAQPSAVIPSAQQAQQPQGQVDTQAIAKEVARNVMMWLQTEGTQGTQSADLSAPRKEENQKVVTLRKGLLKEWLAAGHDFALYKDVLAQRVVYGVGFGEHPLKVGHLMQRISGYIKVKRSGTYVFRFVNGPQGERVFFHLEVDGNPTVFYLSSPDKKDVEVPLVEGFRRFALYFGYVREEREQFRPPVVEITFAPMGQPLKPMAVGSYPDYYELYYDKSEATMLAEAETIFKVEEGEDEEGKKK